MSKSVYLSFFYFVIFSFLVSCAKRESKEEFHKNGRLRIRFESINGKKDGVLYEYDSNGTLRYIENWKNGVMNGPFEEYYPSGKILRKGVVSEGKTVSSTIFYENGNIFKKETFDSNGFLFDVEEFNEDGTRDTVPYPIAKIYNIKLGEKALLTCRMVNFSKPIDSLGVGQLIITNGFLDTLSYEIAMDTIAIVNPENGREFYYEFTPKLKGVNKLYGVLTYSKKDKDILSISLDKIEEEFVVY